MKQYTKESIGLVGETAVPCRIRHDNGADAGWTVRTFRDAEQAALHVLVHRSEYMPAWDRFVIVDGALHIPMYMMRHAHGGWI